MITGLGIVSSIGIGWEEFWNNLLKGKSGISPISSFDTSSHFNHNGGEVRNFSPDDRIRREKLPFLSRASQLGISAAALAFKDSNLPIKLSNRKVGACIGITSGSVQAIEHINDRLMRCEEPEKSLLCQLPVHSTTASIADEFALNGPNYIFSTACSAGNYALGYGFDLIRLSRADIVFAGGSDPFSRISFTGFNQFSAVAPEKCQPFDRNRKGMMVAEGAAVLILEALEGALERDAHIYAEILGYGLSCDAGHMTQPSVEGVAQCMLKAMREAGIERDEVDYISAHGTGTIANDKLNELPFHQHHYWLLLQPTYQSLPCTCKQGDRKSPSRFFVFGSKLVSGSNPPVRATTGRLGVRCNGSRLIYGFRSLCFGNAVAGQASGCLRT